MADADKSIVLVFTLMFSVFALFGQTKDISGFWSDSNGNVYEIYENKLSINNSEYSAIYENNGNKWTVTIPSSNKKYVFDFTNDKNPVVHNIDGVTSSLKKGYEEEKESLFTRIENYFSDLNLSSKLEVLFDLVVDKIENFIESDFFGKVADKFEGLYEKVIDLVQKNENNSQSIEKKLKGTWVCKSGNETHTLTLGGSGYFEYNAEIAYGGPARLSVGSGGKISAVAGFESSGEWELIGEDILRRKYDSVWSNVKGAPEKGSVSNKSIRFLSDDEILVGGSSTFRRK